jgi:hypothetical protein
MSSVLDITQTTDALSKVATNNLQRKRNPNTSLQKLSMKEFYTTIHKKSQKSANFSYTRNYTITERTGEMDVLKLKNWDIENLIHIKTESDLLYCSLNDFYQKINNIEKIEKLNSYQKIIDTSNTDVKKILKSKSKLSKNKILDNLIKKNHEEQGTILLNSIAKTKNKFNITSMENKKQNDLAQNFGFESQALNSVSKNNNLNSQFYRRVIKEKVGQENYSRQELMQITLKYMDKKNERMEKEAELSKIFIDMNNLTNKFNEEKNKIKIEILNNQEFMEKIKKEGKISKEESMLLTRQKAIERINLEKKIKEKYKIYLLEYKKIEDEKNKMKSEIDLLKEEENYLKLVKLSLLSNQREYYLDILKKGYDVRKEGLVWCVKHLLELETDLEYYHFPKFLNHQECDYLIEQGNISLEIMQLKIIVKVMKEKNEKSNVDKKFEYFNKMAIAAKNTKHRRKSLLQQEIENIKKEKFNMSKTDKHLHKIFNKVLMKHKETFKFLNDKKLEDLKIENITKDLKQTLLEKGGNFGENYEELNSVLNMIESDIKTKNYLESIITLRTRLDYLKKKSDQIKENQLKLFKTRIDYNKRINKIMTAETSLQNDLVFSALFGNTIIPL